MSATRISVPTIIPSTHPGFHVGLGLGLRVGAGGTGTSIPPPVPMPMLMHVPQQGIQGSNTPRGDTATPPTGNTGSRGGSGGHCSDGVQGIKKDSDDHGGHRGRGVYGGNSSGGAQTPTPDQMEARKPPSDGAGSGRGSGDLDSGSGRGSGVPHYPTGPAAPSATRPLPSPPRGPPTVALPVPRGAHTLPAVGPTESDMILGAGPGRSTSQPALNTTAGDVPTWARREYQLMMQIMVGVHVHQHPSLSQQIQPPAPSPLVPGSRAPVGPGAALTSVTKRENKTARSVQVPSGLPNVARKEPTRPRKRKSPTVTPLTNPREAIYDSTLGPTAPSVLALLERVTELPRTMTLAATGLTLAVHACKTSYGAEAFTGMTAAPHLVPRGPARPQYVSPHGLIRQNRARTSGTAVVIDGGAGTEGQGGCGGGGGGGGGDEI